MNKNHKKVVIIDFGSQYTQLIARRIRELGIYCEIHSPDVSKASIYDSFLAGIIFSGGPDSVTDAIQVGTNQRFYDLHVPILGICYGMQILAVDFGGRVASSSKKEFGNASVRAHGHSKLLKDISDYSNNLGNEFLEVWMSHGDSVIEIPDGFKLIASSENCSIAGIANEDDKIFGLQFHPEVTHTQQGERILERFCVEICGCNKTWTTKAFIDETLIKIKEIVGEDKVILGLSGGVDSSVVAALVHKAIGKQLTCVFVDNGLLRTNESKEVKNFFQYQKDLNIVFIDASEEFLTALTGVIDPELKRKIIGEKFVEVFERQSKKILDAKWLAQGTIYPDVIESSTDLNNSSQVIKSHHNVGGLPDKMKLKLLEPLRELFKDEVRRVGLELEVPKEIIFRHPFPGPGLAVRILGEVTKDYADILRQADKIFIEELLLNDLYESISQAFAVFLPIKAVGVKGDARVYEYVIALRAVETIDFMTANWVSFKHDFLDRVSNRIMNEVAGISRVVLDISSKPPATIEWE